MVHVEIAASLRALLRRSIDYAGLFPPAGLELERAVKEYASYLRSNEAWMLSTFVLPVKKFGEAAWFVSEFDEDSPFRISALGTKTINAIDFIEELKSTAKGVREFAGEYPKEVRIEQLEMPLPATVTPELLLETSEILGELSVAVFLEAPVSEAEKTISLLAEHNAETGNLKLNFKLRTGGVTVDAFPAASDIAKAIVTVARDRVPIKFTAGLHHPVRLFRHEVKTKMHGFLNVLGAGVLALEHGWNEHRTAAMLEEENPESFIFDGSIFRWRDWEIGSEAIERQRRLITSFGSCSFDEPREDLRALKLL